MCSFSQERARKVPNQNHLIRALSEERSQGGSGIPPGAPRLSKGGGRSDWSATSPRSREGGSVKCRDRRRNWPGPAQGGFLSPGGRPSKVISPAEKTRPPSDIPDQPAALPPDKTIPLPTRRIPLGKTCSISLLVAASGSTLGLDSGPEEMQELRQPLGMRRPGGAGDPVSINVGFVHRERDVRPPGSCHFRANSRVG